MALVPCPHCSRLVRSRETTCPFCDARGVSSAALFAFGLAVAGCHGTPASSSTDGALPAPSASVVTTPSATPSAGAAPTRGDLMLGGLAAIEGGSPDRMQGTVYGGPPPPRDGAVASPTGELTLGTTGGVGHDDRFIAGVRAGLRTCYQKGLDNDPSMEGKASFRVEVSATGTAKATTASTAGLSSSVETCMLHKLGRLAFDAAPAHTVVVDVVAKKQTR
jgi:hypothetical protein